MLENLLVQQTGLTRLWEIQPQPEDEFNQYQQFLIHTGQVKYEMSQIRAALKMEWRSLLDDAEARFKKARCHPKDILQTMQAHVQAAELNLPETVDEVRHCDIGIFLHSVALSIPSCKA